MRETEKEIVIAIYEQKILTAIVHQSGGLSRIYRVTPSTFDEIESLIADKKNKNQE